jgi:dimethylaniline monooxygenase (N-oxide forming)
MRANSNVLILEDYSVNGEYRFSGYHMPERPEFEKTGGRLSGEDLRMYMETYADRFLHNNIRYNAEVTNIRRIDIDSSGTSSWVVTITDKISGTNQKLQFDKIVLCTGVSYVHAVPSVG